MKIVKADVLAGVFSIFNDEICVATVQGEQLARQFAVSDEMLVVCKLLKKYHQQANLGFDLADSWPTLQKAVAAALAVIAKVEPGNGD